MASVSVIPRVFCVLLAGTLFPCAQLMAQEENLNVLDRWIEWSDGQNMLIHFLNQQAFEHLDRRDAEVSMLKNRADWKKRQTAVRETLLRIVGPFPEKTPLNPRITGVVKKEGFTIEKLIYESIPNLHVTAALFIPEGITEKRPAVIQVSGHGFAAFRSSGNQRMIYNLVRKGFFVMAIDPLGQGERIQYWDPEKKVSMVGNSPTSEHSYFGNQMFLGGVSPGRYFTWDGIRGVDYLMTRSEVDPDRIGIFGCSGGGTQTTYIAAFDDRIKAAAPGCYITGFRRLMESIGPQDAEQNFYLGVANGITHADLLEVRAPKPLLIASTTRDFFSIQGAVETFEEVRRAYETFGLSGKVRQAIDDAGHGFHGNADDVYAFFQQTLDLPGESGEEEFDGFNPEELRITETGQLSTSLGGETAFSLNQRYAQSLLDRIAQSRTDISRHLKEVRERAVQISGFAAPESGNAPVFRGRYQRDGYSVEMYALSGEGHRYVIPLLLFVPHGSGPYSTVIYLHPDGKLADSGPGGRIERLVKKGYLVAAPDLLGTGETEPETLYAARYAAVLTGRSLVAIKAGDVVRVAKFLQSRDDVETAQIGAISFGVMGPPLLHAAAFDSSIKNVAIVDSLISYRSIVMNRFYEVDFSAFVAGTLTAYDLPDLVGCIAPRKIALIGLQDQMNRPASQQLISEELGFPRSAFASRGLSRNLRVLSDESIETTVDWCFSD